MNRGREAGKVLVLGADTRAFLAVVRSLGRAGLDVHVAWFDPHGAAMSSRYIGRADAIPPQEDPAWVDALPRLVERERFDLVIPCEDSSLVALYRNRSEFEPMTLLALPNDAAFDVLFDKHKSSALAGTVGAHVPREVIVTKLGDASGLRSEFSLPIVLKPQASHDPINPGPRRRVRKAYTWQELDLALGDMLADGPVAVQENFIGRGVGVELLVEQGEPLLAFQHVRIHEPLRGGGSSYRQSVALSPELLKVAADLLRATKYTGVAMVEFKVNPASGQWIFIEVNARFWGSLPLAIAAGVSFPLALYEFLVEGRRSFAQEYRIGLFSRNLASDVRWQIANFRADRSDPTLATSPIWQVVRETTVNLVTGRERYDEFTWDDPGPGLAVLRHGLRNLGRIVKQKSTARLMQTSLMRVRAAAHVRDGLATAKSVLFVCKGNICRSPFAEHAARRMLSPDVTVSSAGYFPKAGRRSPERAVIAAARHNIDLSGHISRVMTNEMLRRAEIVFVFDNENYEHVVHAYPFTKGKVHFLGALNRNRPLFIDDPWSGDDALFNQTYALIASALQAAAPDKPRLAASMPSAETPGAAGSSF